MDTNSKRAPKTQSLTQDELKRLLDYNPETGIFTWKVKTGRLRTGTKAGSDRQGQNSEVWYTRICVLYREYPAHRLAFLWMTGSFPTNDVDHIDSNGLNNKWNNLREASASQNTANSRKKMKKDGLPRGVTKSGKNTYVAKISVNGRQIYFGVFQTLEEAHAVYNAAAIKYHGEFARGHSLDQSPLEICKPLMNDRAF